MKAAPVSFLYLLRFVIVFSHIVWYHKQSILF